MPVTTIANAKPALPMTSAARKPPSAITARSNHIQRECKPGRNAHARRDRQQASLPVTPREEFDYQQPHAAGQVRRQQQHEAGFGKLHERRVGPPQETIERFSAGQCLSERPEMKWQKKREQEAGYAMHDECPVRGVAARAKVVAAGHALHAAWVKAHTKTAHTARAPASASATAIASTNRSSVAPRHPAVSAMMLRSPIGACTETAATNSR